jgi:hypothetical protein
MQKNTYSAVSIRNIPYLTARKDNQNCLPISRPYGTYNPLLCNKLLKLLNSKIFQRKGDKSKKN